MHIRALTVCVTLALMGAAPMIQGEDFGRLFTSRAQRDALQPGVAQGSQEISALTVNGVVIRPRKEKVGWIDQRSTLDNPHPGVRLVDVRGTTNSPVLPLVVGNARRLTMKPGQVWLPAVDRVVESYEAPSIIAGKNGQAVSGSASAATENEPDAPAESGKP